MTREEAEEAVLKFFERPYSDMAGSAKEYVDLLETLGLLKLDKPLPQVQKGDRVRVKIEIESGPDIGMVATVEGKIQALENI